MGFTLPPSTFLLFFVDRTDKMGITSIKTAQNVDGRRRAPGIKPARHLGNPWRISNFVADMADNDWKARLGVVYSTNPDFQYTTQEEEEAATLEPGKQRLIVGIDRRNRGGKQVTLITGFVGTADDLKALAKTLKTRLGVGGSAKDGEITIQGDFRDKVTDLLKQLGYNAKRGN